MSRSALLYLLATLLLPFPNAWAKSPTAQVAQQLDRVLAKELEHSPNDLAPQCDDATYLRRVYLDIVGDIPTPEDTTAFLLDPDKDKRAKVVRRLLDQPQYGQNWARYWRDVILYRRLEDRSVLVAGALVEGLTKQLNENQSWDQIASGFITAKGDIRDHGQTAIIAAQDGRTEEVAAEVSRIFLGIQIQCAQCHDHPWDSWKREQFHEFAAFFPRIAVQNVQSPLRRSFEVVANDRPDRGRRRNNNNRRGTAEHYMPDMQDPQARGTRMQPRFFLTSAQVRLGTRDADRRGKAAEWVTDSPWFARAMVNRMWAELVGEPFYETIDDLGPERDAKAPQSVELLADGFAQSGFDVKWLMQVIASTEAYQRECRPRRTPDAKPMTANVAQRLRGDQLYSTLLTALAMEENRRASLGGRYGNGLRGGLATPRGLFNVAFGFDPSIDKESVSASIPQALALMNTRQINNAVKANRRTMLGKLLGQITDDQSLIEELYLRCLSREPTPAELASAIDFSKSVDSRREAFEDLLWALVNSAEFAHRR